jgi:hypothetical protein
LIDDRCDMLTRTAMFGTKYLEETGWKNPSEPRDGFLQYANFTKLHLFDYLASQPSLFADFNLFMGATNGTMDYWWNWYDIQGRLLDGYNDKKSDVLLVDVGGGKGHDLQVFHERFAANHSGSLVLQDLPVVIEGIQGDSLDSRITKMGHDFFEPQPVKGESFYIMLYVQVDRMQAPKVTFYTIFSTTGVTSIANKSLSTCAMQ